MDLFQANFSGTDNNVAIELCRQYYSESPDYMPGFSGVASEHSVMTSWGPKREKEAFEVFNKHFYFSI